jgi:hypothetical protein
MCRYNNVNPRAALDELKGKDKLSESQAQLAQRLTAAQVQRVLVMGRKGERGGGREGGRERVREEGKDGGVREGSGSRG